EPSAVFAGPIECAQELVAEIPVAVFEVDELEPRRPRSLPRAHEVLDQRVELGVGEARRSIVEAEPPIENRMVIDDARFGMAVLMRTRKAARVRELEADVEIICRSEPRRVLAHEGVAQRGERADRLVRDDELI